MASLGVPILGDELYGGAVADRCYLHAYCLHFRYQDAVTGWRDYTYLNIPQQGEAFQLEAVSDALALWHKPETLAWPSKE